MNFVLTPENIDDTFSKMTKKTISDVLLRSTLHLKYINKYRLNQLIAVVVKNIKDKNLYDIVSYAINVVNAENEREREIERNHVNENDINVNVGDYCELVGNNVGFHDTEYVRVVRKTNKCIFVKKCIVEHIKNEYIGNSCDYNVISEALPEINENIEELRMRIIDYEPCEDLNNGNRIRYSVWHGN